MMTLEQAKNWIATELASVRWSEGLSDEQAGQINVQRVTTDSRTIEAGDLFIALVGERFNGHQFLEQAKKAGASAAIVQHGQSIKGLSCIEVSDTLQALTVLARQWRRQFNIPVLAVTGSNGKTTVTQMLGSILDCAYGDAALFTRGNFNNEIGVPLMVLRLRANHRAAVFELGMNHPGEIRHLASIAQPTVGLINNAQREHLEFMQSIDAVAHENGCVLETLPADGVAVIPADDAYTALWQHIAGTRRRIEFGNEKGQVHLIGSLFNSTGWHLDIAVSTAHALTAGGDEKVQHLNINLKALGQHNVHNALAAVAGALALGINHKAIAEGLAQFSPVKGRSAWHVIHRKDGSEQLLIDDSYNANPDSVRAAIDLLASLPSPRVLVLGDMAEVGEQERLLHEEVGAYAKSQGVDALLTFGSLAVYSAKAFGTEGKNFADFEALQQALGESIQAARSIAVKGSRLMRMERAVETILQQEKASLTGEGVEA